MGMVENRSKTSGSVLHVSISYNTSMETHVLHDDYIQNIKKKLTNFIAENKLKVINEIIYVTGFQPNSK